MVCLELEDMHFQQNILTILCTLWWNKLFGAQIKPLQLVIIIYSVEAEKFGLHFFTLVVSRVNGEQVAFSNNHHSLGREMTEHFMKYVHTHIKGNACEGT